MQKLKFEVKHRNYFKITPHSQTHGAWVQETWSARRRADRPFFDQRWCQSSTFVCVSPFTSSVRLTIELTSPRTSGQEARRTIVADRSLKGTARCQAAKRQERAVRHGVRKLWLAWWKSIHILEESLSKTQRIDRRSLTRGRSVHSNSKSKAKA